MGVNGSVVVDASVAVKWFVREEHTDKALAILRAWRRDSPVKFESSQVGLREGRRSLMMARSGKRGLRDGHLCP